MADARELQYGIDFDTGDAGESIERLNQAIESMEAHIDSAETGVQRFGAGAVSACNNGQQGARELSACLDMAGDAIVQAGDAADAFGQQAGEAAEGARQFGAGISGAGGAAEKFNPEIKTAADVARQFGREAEAAGDGVDNLRDGVQNASTETRCFRDDLDDARNEAERFRNQVRETAEGAADLGAAFRESMAAGLEAGQSIAKSFGTGITGSIDFSRNKVKTFVSDTLKGAKNIGTAFKSPVQTIRNNLVDALKRAKAAEDETGDGAEDAERDLDDMGDAGENAGNAIKEAMSGAIKAFVGFEVIKKGIDLMKQFGAAALEAFGATETSAAKFDRVFSDEAAGWVDNYADAVHRSTTEVKGFMVQNQAMYREMGMTADQAETLSEITTSLGYDFGNAFKMEDAEALSLVQSAIQGDTAALSEFGIVLDKTALKQSAAALGVSTNIDALDDATAAQVRLNAILEQSTDIQQAAINSTGGLVNSTKSLKGIFNEFLSDAGEKFVPAVESITGAVIDEWPTLEPMLLSFVDVLSSGLADVVPVLITLGQKLIPVVSSTLGTLMEVAAPLAGIIGSLAGSVLPPLANIFSELATYALPPLLSIIEELNISVIQPLMPVVEELASQLLPVLGMALSSVASLVGPLASAFMPLLEEILPVFGSLISTLATSIIPPLTEVLQVVIQALEPIIDLAVQIVDAILPAATPLIEAVGTILSGVIVPVLETLSPVLSFVADVLGTVVGWVADLIGFFANGVSKVVDWFAGLFSGAKESTSAVEELTGAVSDLDGAAGQETSLAVDTSEYSSSVSTASQEATNAVTEAATAARNISNENYTLMADDAETAYARMTLDAESAWDRMTTAAEDGAAKIVASFGEIASAALTVNSANISVSGVSIPGNAEGTDNWRGGWTRMNEEGGELAYLPSGTAIIPADKTDEIISNSTSSEYVDSSTFAPQISISLGDDVSPETADDLAQTIKDLMEKFWREKKEQEYHDRAMQGAYAR